MCLGKPPAGRLGSRYASDEMGGIKLALAVLLGVVVVVAAVGWLARPALPDGIERWLNPIAYGEEIAAAASEHDLDVHLVLAVVKAESGFRRDAQSSVGAIGLMQLMPETAQWIVGRDDWSGPSAPDLVEPTDNLALGCYYLRFLMDMYDDDLIAALAAYNAGQGVVNGWLSSKGDDSRKSLTLTDIPFPDTRDFVRRVTEYRELYARIYPGL